MLCSHPIEIVDNNVLTAVVKGTEANAHLVATVALAHGIEATAEQYGIRMAQVHGMLAFYYENQAEIDQGYLEARANIKTNAVDAWQGLEEMRRRKKIDKTAH